MVIKIAHLADIHIKNNRREEYANVFQKLYDSLRENSPNIIVIAGDVFDDKMKASALNIKDVSEFLQALTMIAPCVMIPGNHDTNCLNPGSYDLLTPIVINHKELQPPRLIYWRESGVYHAHDILWTVIAPDGEQPSIEDEISKKQLLQKVPHICLLHEEVNGARLPNNQNLNGFKLSITALRRYDIVMAGHIHVRQQFSLNMAYCGSLIQQTIGESHLSHGYILWSIDNIPNVNTVTFKEIDIHNDEGFIRIIYDKNGKNITELPLPNNPIYWEVIHDGAPLDKIDNEIEFYKQIFKMPPRAIRSIAKSTSLTDLTDLSDLIDLTEAQAASKSFTSHEEIIRELINENVDEVIKMHKIHYNEESDYQMYNGKFRIRKLVFDNMYAFGRSNTIDFTKLEGCISGVIAANHTGKSSIIETLLFALYEEYPRAPSIKDIVHKGSSSCKLQLEFELDGKIGKIEKGLFATGGSNSKGSQYHFEYNGENRTQGGTPGTIKEIEKVLGDGKTALASSFQLQGSETLGFIGATLSERKKLLASVMMLGSFDKIERTVTKELTAAGSEVKLLTSQFRGTKLEDLYILRENEEKILIKTKNDLEQVKNCFDLIQNEVTVIAKELGSIKLYTLISDNIKKHIKLICSSSNPDLLCEREIDKWKNYIDNAYVDESISDKQLSQIKDIPYFDNYQNDLTDYQNYCGDQIQSTRELINSAVIKEREDLLKLSQLPKPISYAKLIQPKINSYTIDDIMLQYGEKRDKRPTNEEVTIAVQVLKNNANITNTANNTVKRLSSDFSTLELKNINASLKGKPPFNALLSAIRTSAICSKLIEDVNILTIQNASKECDRMIETTLINKTSYETSLDILEKDILEKDILEKDILEKDILEKDETTIVYTTDLAVAANEVNAVNTVNATDEVNCINTVNCANTSNNASIRDLEYYKNLLQIAKEYNAASIAIQDIKSKLKLQDNCEGCICTFKIVEDAIKGEDKLINAKINYRKRLNIEKNKLKELIKKCEGIISQMNKLKNILNIMSLYIKKSQIENAILVSDSILVIESANYWISNDIKEQQKYKEQIVNNEQIDAYKIVENNYKISSKERIDLENILQTLLTKEEKIKKFKNIAINAFSYWKYIRSVINEHKRFNEISKKMQIKEGEREQAHLQLTMTQQIIATSEREITRLNVEISIESVRAPQLALAEKNRSVLQSYKSVLKPNGGIGDKLLSRARTSLHTKINEALVELGSNFEINITDDFNIYQRQFTDQNWIPVSLSSGYQKFVLSLATRLSIWRLSCSPRPDAFIIDEGFGACDENYLDSMASALETLSTVPGGPRLVFIVSHIDTLKTRVERPLEITVNPSGSYVSNQQDDNKVIEEVISTRSKKIRQPARIRASNESVKDIKDVNITPDSLDSKKIFCKACCKSITVTHLKRHLASGLHKDNCT